MNHEPSKEKLKKIEHVFKQDIKWAITKGPGFCGLNGVVRTPSDQFYNGKVTKGWEKYNCGGVCAVGAMLLRRDKNYNGVVRDDAVRAATLLRTSEEWMYALYVGVGNSDEDESENKSAWKMSQRLYAYARTVKANFLAKKRALKAKAK